MGDLSPDPDLKLKKSWKESSFSQMGRNLSGQECGIRLRDASLN
jgi:hypothetical protein